MKDAMFVAVVLNGQYLVSFKVDVENAFPLVTFLKGYICSYLAFKSTSSFGILYPI